VVGEKGSSLAVWTASSLRLRELISISWWDDDLEEGERVLVLGPLPWHGTRWIGSDGRRSSHAGSRRMPSPRRQRWPRRRCGEVDLLRVS
jgi:hypothetical protein